MSKCVWWIDVAGVDGEFISDQRLLKVIVVSDWSKKN